MISRQVGYALSVRISSSATPVSALASREVLLEQRPASETVMPGLWELPTLLSAEVPESDLRLTLRHAIMQVNYYVRIRTVFEDDAPQLTVENGLRRWVLLKDAAQLPLTGVARKVLTRTHLLPATPRDQL